MKAVEFNERESPDKVIGRLCREANADIVIPFDCADSRVNFEVRGYFVIPDKAVFKLVADHAS